MKIYYISQKLDSRIRGIGPYLSLQKIERLTRVMPMPMKYYYNYTMWRWRWWRWRWWSIVIIIRWMYRGPFDLLQLQIESRAFQKCNWIYTYVVKIHHVYIIVMCVASCPVVLDPWVWGDGEKGDEREQWMRVLGLMSVDMGNGVQVFKLIFPFLFKIWMRL